MAASLLRLARPRRALLLPISSLRLALSTQPRAPSPSPPPSSGRRLPHFLPFLAAAAAAAAAGGANVALCDSGLDHHRVGGKDSTDLVVRGERKRVPQDFIDELASFLGENMTLDYDERSFHGTPQNSFHKAVNVPDVVVFPSSQDEVQKIVMACNKYKVPIVPYGGATSIEGHTLAPHGGVCIDMTLMKKIKSLNVEDMDVVVEPGVGWIELNEYLKPYGLFFPLDPVYENPEPILNVESSSEQQGCWVSSEELLKNDSTEQQVYENPEPILNVESSSEQQGCWVSSEELLKNDSTEQQGEPPAPVCFEPCCFTVIEEDEEE